MKRITALALCLAAFVFVLNAQVITEQEIQDLLNSQEMQVYNPSISNFLMIRQINDGNEVIARQNNPSGLQNKILMNQNGINNKGSINQNGSGLETNLWQYDSSNEATLVSEGENISTSVKQDGAGNIINSYIKNHHLDARTAMLLQEGSNNRIDLDLREAGVPASSGSQMFSVTQNGNGHGATITGVDFDSPITVEQTAGAGGEGMQIEINTSYFSFPMAE